MGQNETLKLVRGVKDTLQSRIAKASVPIRFGVIQGIKEPGVLVKILPSKHVDLIEVRGTEQTKVVAEVFQALHDQRIAV